MQLTILQAILIGIYYWTSKNLLGYTLSGALYFAPLPAALFVGIVLGNVPLAMVVGAALQLMYLGIIAPGGNLPQDPILATLLATTVVLSTGAQVETAISLAIPLGLLGAQIWNLNRTLNVIWVHMADRYAEQGNTTGIYLAGLVYPVLMRIPLCVLPVALAAYFGPTFIQGILNAIPESIMHGLSVVGGVMPAVGFAIVITIIGRKSLLPYFFAGFFLLKYSGVGILPLAIAGAMLAFLVVTFTFKKSEVE
jgi:PTS system mannose-specific IIC component